MFLLQLLPRFCWTGIRSAIRSPIPNASTNISSIRCLSSMLVAQYIKRVVEDEQIIKSGQDKRKYRALELHNGMQVMLVSDPQTDKSSAAMDVYIGHMKDPRDIPGLAHFCEHMLFLGTQKYPEENEYTKIKIIYGNLETSSETQMATIPLQYLTTHGGSSNAFTSSEHTNFYFDIAPEHLPGALDRFAQFFLEPLFTESATEREINAVNSENDKNMQSDAWRIHQLEKSLADPRHDYCKFGTGNKVSLETRAKKLGYNVRNELLAFHAQHYSSNLMGFCVLGRESLDELANMTVPLLAHVQDKQLAQPFWDTHPFGPDQLQRMCYVVPVKDIRNLTVTWSIPDLHQYYKTNPGHYLGHLIGHEGKGSLLSELKTAGWVNTLVGGQQSGARGFMFFMVNVDLTEDGLEHVDDIITRIYQYIHMLQQHGPQERIFNECKDLGAMQFRFKDKEKPRGYTSAVSGLLHDYPAEEVFSAHFLQTEYQPELIDLVMEKLTPHNMRVAVVAKMFAGQTESTEEWYGTEYRLEKISPDKLQAWAECGLHESLSLPEKNEFIPTNFDIMPREPEQAPFPVMIKNTTGTTGKRGAIGTVRSFPLYYTYASDDSGMTRLWFRQDDKFLLPKAFVNFEITSPLVYIDPLNANLATLFVHLFQDALNEYSYAADIAGLRYNLDSTVYGVNLGVKGYSDKLAVLLQKVIEKMVSFTVDPQRYNVIKELYGRSLRNFHAEQPHQHAVYFTSVLMSELLWTQEELLEALDEVSIEKLATFIPQLLSKLYIEGIVYGNVTKQQALDITSSVEHVFHEAANTRELLPSQRRRLRELQLPAGAYYVYHRTNTVHRSSSLELYYQVGQQATQTNMLLELFVQVISEPCFNVLRTQEQLGYIVFSGIRRSSGVQGLRVIVQSDRTPEYVEGRVEAFLNSMKDNLELMTDEEYQKHVSALTTKRSEKAKKMSVQCGQYWGEISSQQYNFDRDAIEVAFLKTVTKDDLLKFYKDNISCEAPNRHKMCVYVLSTAGTGEGKSPDGDNPAVGPGEGKSPDVDGPAVEPGFHLPTPVVIQDVTTFKREMGLFPLPKPFIDLQKAVSKL